MTPSAAPHRATRAVAHAVALVVAALSLAACQFGSDPETTGASVASGLPTASEPGGNLTALAVVPVDTWDPQRMGSKADGAFAGRLFLRTLTAYAPALDVSGQREVVGDLATSTGEASKDLRTWTFTLCEGVSWQDGSPLTCEDVKYGISRTFATDVITGGPAYAIALLDIPKTPDGESLYRGPYDTSKAAKPGIVAFDKAVSCKGATITFRLSGPENAFNEVLTLPAFAPVKQSKDMGEQGRLEVFSCGPYQLKGQWSPGTGGVFVRNAAWKSASDPIRKALPNQVTYRENQQTAAIVQQVLGGTSGGDRAVSLASAPPALQQQITASRDLQGRTINPGTGLMDYLAPNLRSSVFSHEEARRALALATDRAAYVAGLGGTSAAAASASLIPAGIAVPASAAPPSPTTSTPSGSPTGKPTATGTARTLAATPSPGTPSPTPSAATPTTSRSTEPSPTGAAADQAKALLAAAGLTTPVKITVAYRQSDSMDKAMAALVPGWQKAGFAPTLKPMGETYFTDIAKAKVTGIDVFWANWAPEWASAATILQPIFDSRLNLTQLGTGRDYGAFADNDLNARMDALDTVADRTAREAGWAAVDADLRARGAYVGLAERRAVYVAGTNVRSFSADEVLGGYVEFATIGVAP